MSKDDNFFKSLRKKTPPEVPEGFDDRFWKKFDRSFSKNSYKKYSFSLQILGLTLVITLFLALWKTSHVPAPRIEVSKNHFTEDATLAEVNEEEMDMALNLDLLEALDTEEELFPKTEEEWNYLLEGDRNG